MPDSSASSALAQVIDDYIVWLVAWHRLTLAEPTGRMNHLDSIAAPASFTRWREGAFAELTLDQPAIEKLAQLQEQLHMLTRLILIKTPVDQAITPQDDDSITAKYRELMQGLRRCESAFDAAASGLDQLTGLKMRGTLWRDLEQELQRFARTGRPFCVAMMDIDHFKKINDSYGHAAGDSVLAAVGNHISRSIRAHDDAYRMGGEEFLLFLKEIDLEKGLLVLERLRSVLAETPIAFPATAPITFTASFGLAVSTKAMTAHELLRQADAALYHAKSTGRNLIVTAEASALLEGKN